MTASNLGRLTTEETADLAREAFDLLPEDEQISLLVELLTNDDVLRDEILAHFEADG